MGEIYGTYDYPNIYYVYNYSKVNGNKIVMDAEPMGRIKARTMTGWRSHRVVVNGLITNAKVTTATIETTSRIGSKLKAEMFLKNSKGTIFKIEEATMNPDLDQEMYGRSERGITTIIISSDND